MPPPPARPSASVLLLSPTNEVLLLHRVQTSSSFASAHVFPGGNYDAFHDGAAAAAVNQHADAPAYRWAAVRECFEESGLLLLATRDDAARLARVPDEERQRARRDVHAGRRRFGDVLTEWNITADVDNLIPFTRWITPSNAARRFTTQMYLYLMPQSSNNSTDDTLRILPSADGGLEHTTARFLPATAWLDLARAGQIILFPPQFFLLHLVAQHVQRRQVSADPPSQDVQRERAALVAFIRNGRWGDKCITPSILVVGGSDGRRRRDGRVVLALDKPGPEMAGPGVSEYVMLVEFAKEGPRRLEVRLRSEVLAEARQDEGKL